MITIFVGGICYWRKRARYVAPAAKVLDDCISMSTINNEDNACISDDAVSTTSAVTLEPFNASMFAVSMSALIINKENEGCKKEDVCRTTMVYIFLHETTSFM